MNSPQVQRWCSSWRAVGAAEVVVRGAQARVRAVRMAAKQAPKSGVMSAGGRICFLYSLSGEAWTIIYDFGIVIVFIWCK